MSEFIHHLRHRMQFQIYVQHILVKITSLRNIILIWLIFYPLRPYESFLHWLLRVKVVWPRQYRDLLHLIEQILKFIRLYWFFHNFNDLVSRLHQSHELFLQLSYRLIEAHGFEQLFVEAVLIVSLFLNSLLHRFSDVFVVITHIGRQ